MPQHIPRKVSELMTVVRKEAKAWRVIQHSGGFTATDLCRDPFDGPVPTKESMELISYTREWFKDEIMAQEYMTQMIWTIALKKVGLLK